MNINKIELIKSYQRRQNKIKKKKELNQSNKRTNNHIDFSIDNETLKIIQKRKEYLKNNTKQNTNLDLPENILLIIEFLSNKYNLSSEEIIESLLIDYILDSKKLPNDIDKCIDSAIYDVKYKKILDSNLNYLILDTTDINSKDKELFLYTKKTFLNTLDEEDLFKIYAKTNEKEFIFNSLKNIFFEKDIENGCEIKQMSVNLDIINPNNKFELGFEVITTISFFGIQEGREDYISSKWIKYNLINNNVDFLKLFSSFNLNNNRCLGSKSLYRKNNKWNTVIFNSSIFVKEKNDFINIWFGDIDISLEGDKLKKISKLISKELYVCYEGLSPKNMKEKYTWNTSKKVPFIDDKKYNKLEKKEKKKNKKLKKKNKKYLKKMIIENHKIPIDKNINTIHDKHIEKVIKIDIKDFEKKLNKFIKKIKKIVKKRNKYLYKDNKNEEDYFVLEELQNKLEKLEYFSYIYTTKLLEKKFNVGDDKQLNYSEFWISDDTNNFFRKIELKIKKLIYKKTKLKNISPFPSVLCNIEYKYLLRDNKKVNMKSYKFLNIYVRKGKYIIDKLKSF